MNRLLKSTRVGRLAAMAARQKQIAWIVLIAIGCFLSDIHAATIANFTGVNPNGTSIPFCYQYLLPPSYNATGPKYPLIVFLHGIGERGTDNLKQMQAEGNTMNGALYLVSNDTTRAAYPFVMVAPQCPSSTEWEYTDTQAKLVTLINTLVTTYNCDPDRIIITGLSLGGMGTWSLVQNNPTMFAAAVPVSSAGDPSQAYKLTNLAVWAFLGMNDGNFPLNTGSSDNSMVQAIRAAGGNPILTLYPNIGHSPVVWSAAYRQPLLIPWMMAQRRAVSPVGSPRLTVATSGVTGLTANLTGTVTDGGLGASAVAYFTDKILPFNGSGANENGTATIYQSGANFTSALFNGILDVGNGQEFARVVSSPSASELTMDHNLYIGTINYKVYSPATGVANWSAAVPLVNGANRVTMVAWANSSGDPGDASNPNAGDRAAVPGFTIFNGTSNVTGGVIGTAPTISGVPSSAVVGTAYSFTFGKTGSPTPTFAVTAGALPPGISLNTTTGVLSGTPTGTGGTYGATVTASNGINPAASTSFTITVNAAPAFISGPAPTTATVGVYYDGVANGFVFYTTGTPAPALSATNVPPGLTFTDLGSGAGKLAGQPTTPGTYNLVISATNNYQSANHVATQNLQIVVSAATSAPAITGTAPAATVGTAYTYTYTVTGSPAPTLSLGSGTLPPGLAISGNSINGTPTGVAGTTYTGTIVATNGIGSPASTPFSILVSSAGTLPGGWSTMDIGTTGALGSASYNSGTGVYAVTGSGSDIWGYNDSFRFLYQSATLNGDGSIVVKVNDIQNTGSWAKSGIMMRADMTTNSPQAMMCISPAGNGATSMMYRSTSGGVSNADTVYNSPAPVWIKLVRAGNVFTGFYGPDGVNWTPVGTAQTIAMPNSIYVGMVECSTASGTLGTAHFSNVTVSSTMNKVTIGSGVTGDASISGNTFTVSSATGASGDCWNTSDSLEYLYEPMTGDGTVIAQVTSMTNTSPYSKCGIMIRKDLTASATHASVFYTPAQGGGSAQANMYWRASQGGITDYSGVGGNYGSTVYLRLVRTGSTFVASISPTGAAGTYVTLGSQTITGMTGTIYVGLMECSHATATGTATFSNVTLP